MPAVRRSASAPRRSSRVSDAEKAAEVAKQKAAAAAAKAQKKAAPAARKAVSKVKKTVKRNVIRPAARAVAKAAGVEADKKPAQKRKAPTDRSEDAVEQKKKARKEEKDKPKEPKPKKEPKAAKKAVAAVADKDVAGKVKVGDIVPDFKLRNEDDKEVSLKDLYSEHSLVIFSYPKADTPGCTTQACLYRDSATEGAFSALGYTVVGLSHDLPAAQNKWKAKHSLGYSLLSDPEGKLLGALGQTSDKKRCHWVVEKGGKLLEAKHGVKPADDAKNALQFIKDLAAGDDKKAE
ncbi:thioredoxin peroxidase DOT5 [Rhodotorula paludigena]|uniref:thioredoxin peroxidase DOT5 n=1 Tax=Rhodotorula paludigena TaxID=86838 RepID=UPI003170FA24